MDSIAFIDTGAHPSADNYFKTFPNEPVLETGWITVGKIKSLPGMTVEGLLQSIRKSAKSGRDILIVCHGTDMGPSLPLVARNKKVLLQQNALTVLKAYGDGGATEDDTAGKMMMSKAGFAAFWRLVQDVAALALNRVEFRSCDVGANKDTLSLLKWFFGSQILGAPGVPDAYVPIDPGTPTSDAATWAGWLKKYKGAQQFGSSPNRFALHLTIGHGVKAEAISESRQAVKDWIKAHLPPGDSYRRGPFPSHGVVDPKAGGIVWAGESGYRGYLRKLGP